MKSTLNIISFFENDTFHKRDYKVLNVDHHLFTYAL